MACRGQLVCNGILGHVVNIVLAIIYRVASEAQY